jgi:hypothetical protein
MASSVAEADQDREETGHGKGDHVTMYQQPAAPRRRAARERLLFTPPVRLGWTFRSRRALITPYPEPPPDPQIIGQQAAARLAAATTSWQRAKKWGIRPSLIIITGLVTLAGCAHAVSGTAPSGTTILTAFILAAPGLGWAGLRYAQFSAAKAADPRHLYQAAHGQWAGRAAEHEQAELDRVAEVPEWGSAELRTPRTDVYGGTLTGWRSLLTVHGASILARQPLLVADLSGQYALAELAALAREARVPSAEYVLPRDLNRSGLLTRLSAQHLADALAEAIHAGPPGTALTDRAVDVRVLEQLSTALAGYGAVTPARLAAAVQVALGRPAEPGLLSEEEEHLIGGKLFGGSYQTQIGTNLVRLDAFLADLARYAGSAAPASPQPAYCTLFAVEPGARSARAELLAALVIQWLTVEVTASTAAAPAVVIAGADEITRQHLERLADACDRRSVPLTLLFRHLRDDATAMIGGGATAFMRLGNHHEAEQAASFIGRHHKFVLSGFTATMGRSHTTTRGEEHGHGTSESRGSSATHGWSDGDHADSYSGSRTRSSESGRSQNWGSSQSQSDGTEWSDASSRQRVYEYAVEPAVLQNLPDNALLLTGRSPVSADLQPVECHPSILTMPHVSMTPLQDQPLYPAVTPQHAGPGQQDRPELAPREYQPRWPPRATQDSQPARQDRRRQAPPLWPGDEPPDRRT